jgi:hypothetical protein
MVIQVERLDADLRLDYRALTQKTSVVKSEISGFTVNDFCVNLNPCWPKSSKA